jgi:hypothetical protein
MILTFILKISIHENSLNSFFISLIALFSMNTSICSPHIYESNGLNGNLNVKFNDFLLNPLNIQYGSVDDNLETYASIAMILI